MKLKYIFIIAVFFNSCEKYHFDKSHVSFSVLDIARKIELNNQLETDTYFEKNTHIQYSHFEKLCKTATDSELIELTNHKNGVVRGYAFWALAHRKNIDIFPILLKHLNDQEIIQVWYGDSGGTEMVGDFMVSVVSSDKVDLDVTKLSVDQRSNLDSILFNTNNKLMSTSFAIENASQNEANYKRLRRLVTFYKNPYALIALSKYRKEQDVRLIKKFINKKYEDFVFKAITNFPHPAFWEPLKIYSENILPQETFSHSWVDLYKAVAMYKNSEAIFILKQPLTRANKRIREFLVDFVYVAISYAHDTIYDDLLFKLWTEENIISYPGMVYLLGQDYNKSINQIWYNIENIDKEENIFSGCVGIELKDGEFGDCKYLIEQMIDIVYKLDRSRTIEILNKNILNKNKDFDIFEAVTKKVSDFKPKESIESLFQRLETETNPYLNITIIRTLLEYNQDKVNKRLMSIRDRKSLLRGDWYGKEIDEILKAKNLLK